MIPHQKQNIAKYVLHQFFQISLKNSFICNYICICKKFFSINLTSFQKNHGTQHALFKMTDTWKKKAKHGSYTQRTQTSLRRLQVVLKRSQRSDEDDDDELFLRNG